LDVAIIEVMVKTTNKMPDSFDNPLPEPAPRNVVVPMHCAR
jgi:hypothetical protein